MRTPIRFWWRAATSKLLRGLVLIIISQVVVTVAFGFLYLYNSSPLLEPLVALAIVAALGLTAGLAARWIFKNQTGLLRLTSAFAAFIASLFYLHFLTVGAMGINLFDPANPNFVGVRLGQIALGCATTLLALRAWRGPLFNFRWLRLPGLPRFPRPAWREEELPRVQITHTDVPPRANPERTVANSARPRWQWPTLPKFQIPNLTRGSRYQVRLGETVDHRCPYCLEPVKPNDPRGIKICKDCHTWHHGDCWAITGMCQVPHHHK